MRLRELEKKSIVKAIKAFDQEAKIYLFGSRVDDNRRGGDIDLLIVTDKLTFDDKLSIKKKIFCEIEDQKIDIIISRNESEPFVRKIFDQGAQLL